ncbi:hypothetical protein EHS25_007323 [Saitozyma podzolica]|uniref:Apple domain-containing protein n=1 Tax=Saitozyma podzolica TaxID=1890683 RepID=A0A427XMJ2_9TREE|nr:hypothetical protein EHS25_007323 [Saitozyma podzolica]
MLVKTLLLIAATFVGLASAGDSSDDDKCHQPILCKDKFKTKTENNGCIRYTQGFDVTGVLTEVDLTFPKVQTVCDCIQACLDYPGTCANYVWKFPDAAAVKTGHRTCTLYSNFNLPANVTVKVNEKHSVDIKKVAANPQVGSLVPQAFSDVAQTCPDDEAFSGPVWQLSNGMTQC